MLNKLIQNMCKEKKKKEKDLSKRKMIRVWLKPRYSREHSIYKLKTNHPVYKRGNSPKKNDGNERRASARWFLHRWFQVSLIEGIFQLPRSISDGWLDYNRFNSSARFLPDMIDIRTLDNWQRSWSFLNSLRVFPIDSFGLLRRE